MAKTFEIALSIFMGVLAFLGKDNPNLVYPEILYLFVLLMTLNLAASATLRRKKLSPALSAGFSVASCGTITAILAYSGGAASNLWVLYILPIFTACLFLGSHETGWITAGVVAFNAVFTLTETTQTLPVALFEVLLKSGFFVFTAVLAWRLASQERQARSDSQRASLRADELTARLESAAALKDVGTVSAGVAHDLRNAFMVIVGFTETTLQDESLGAEARGALERILRMASLGTEMAGNLARHGGEVKLELAPEDLSPIAAGMARLVKAAFLQRDVFLDVEAGEPCPVSASRVHVQRLLLNLLLNALSVSSKGQRVRLAVRRKDSEAVAVVEDQGHGFSRETLARLFEPYQTTRGQGGGTGLGLNLSARIARQHGGTLAAENRPEGGARLILRLPLRV